MACLWSRESCVPHLKWTQETASNVYVEDDERSKPYDGPRCFYRIGSCESLVAHCSQRGLSEEARLVEYTRRKPFCCPKCSRKRPRSDGGGQASASHIFDCDGEVCG